MRTMYILRTDDRPTSHFGKFRTAISRQRVIWSTLCLVLGRVFGDDGSNGAIPVAPNPRRRLAAILENFKRYGHFGNGHISGTGRPIDFVFDPGVGFSGMADRMDLLLVVQNPRFGRPPSWKILHDHISGMSYPIHFHELHSSLEE